MELFEEQKNKKEVSSTRPLAERMRPQTLDEVIGQEHLVGENAPFRKFINSGKIPSMIFWGPPGVGKTTFAGIIANSVDMNYKRISAVEAGVKDVRNILAVAERSSKATLLFIDEIHRFNKSQQDSLLHAVETGIITLLGATTENPSFEVNAALLSRSRVYKLKELSEENIIELVERAIKQDILLKELEIEIADMKHLVRVSGGDARTALNALENAVSTFGDEDYIRITPKLLENILQAKTTKYDKKGEEHYDTISAFIKSMRGSDPDASIFWLAKMLDAGEDPKFIARRMVVFASEDIGNAEPNALRVALSTFDAVNLIGMPEARINLAQGVTYLAACPKSNAAYVAINEAMSDIKKGANLTVPIHLRNAPTKMMKDDGYSKDYKYPHDFDQNFINQSYFPQSTKPKKYYNPSENGKEKSIKNKLDKLWKNR